MEYSVRNEFGGYADERWDCYWILFCGCCAGDWIRHEILKIKYSTVNWYKEHKEHWEVSKGKSEIIKAVYRGPM